MKLCLHCNQYFDQSLEQCPSDGTVLESEDRDLLIGALINNRYLVDSVIGKGSSGTVYKARRLGRGETVVAIKVLHNYISSVGSSLDRFLREAQAASKLRNPHIITIWDTGVTEDGQPYFVMDYLEGTTLGCLIKEKGNLEPKHVLSLLRQICEALGEAHRQGIVHRDLKPENIVLQESDHGHDHDYVKLLDFGIADSPQHAQSSIKLEKPRTVSGSPAYMSPEQCQGLDLDGRSDVYSLAIVVFEMLTGRRPFPQLENVNVMVLHVNEPPMTLAAVRPDLNFPPAVETVIMRALSKQPFDRQSSVHEFLLEFEMAWQGTANPLSALAKAVVQQRPVFNENTFIHRKEDYANAVTSDDLPSQPGDELKPAWGNVLLESSSKMGTIPENKIPYTECQTAQENSQLYTASPEKRILQQSIAEQAMTKSKTVDRLMEAAKRGQTGGHRTLNSSGASNSEPAQIDLSQIAKTSHIPYQTQSPLSEKEVPTPSKQLIASDPDLIRNTIPPFANTIPSPAPILFGQDSNFSVPGANHKKALNIENAELTNAAPELSYATNNYSTASLPASDQVQPSFKNEARNPMLSAVMNSENPLPAEQPVSKKPYSRARAQEPITSRQEIKDEKDNGFHIKQRYRNTLSRLESARKAFNPADKAMLSTRARAAALKAESVRPPINFWFFAITAIISICLLASAYIVYAALIAPVPPVTSIDILRSSGKYGEIIVLLERRKRLSEPLTKAEEQALNEAYLHRDNRNLAENKSDKKNN